MLKKKQDNRLIVTKTIDKIVAAKESVLNNSITGRSICLVGHSQLDQWAIDEIGGYRVRNCGISGISSFEYKEKILNLGKLNCDSDVFLVMHGTNDIVYDYTMDEIVESVKYTIGYIKNRNSAARILFLACLHVNGRLDRSNVKIDLLNSALKENLDNIAWIDTSFMNDQYRNLDDRYTRDGLHINELGYEILQKAVEEKMKEIGL